MRILEKYKLKESILQKLNNRVDKLRKTTSSIKTEEIEKTIFARNVESNIKKIVLKT